jgi:hypothetical protein
MPNRCETVTVKGVKRGIALMLTMLIVIVGAWGAGEIHRHNCVSAHRVGCSVLPWDNGHKRKPAEPNLFKPNPDSNGGF